jgi:perosamine synthetase
MLFGWRNTPWVIGLGASRRAVEAEEHHRWFAETLGGDKRELFIIEIDGIPFGMIRYDLLDGNDAEISIYLMPLHSGQGYGRQVFMATAPDFIVRRGVARVIARVLPQNAHSVRFFETLGFRQVGFDDTSGYLFALDRGVVQHSRPWIGKEEASAVESAVVSRQIAQGARVEELERRWATATQTHSAVAVGSGLAALRLSLLALGIGPGDEVIVPAYSCVALLNAPLALGAIPVLADIRCDDWTLSPEDVARRITARTKAIIAVHLFGVPAEMLALMKFGVPIVEDCAHGIGGFCDGGRFGSCGTLSVASFYATKMLAAGEGGVVAANSDRLLDRIRRARNYGDQPPDGRHLNDKMTDLEAVLALAQLARLPEILSRRAQRAERYGYQLHDLANKGLIRLPAQAPHRIWYRYAVRLLKHRAPDLVDTLAKLDVKVDQPVWDLRETAYWSTGLEATALAFDRVLSLPLYPDLSDWEQALVCAALRTALSE